ncbi:sulfatase [Echinicola strongylocentroti]|uniref:Sulfatase n=1 Tax=Echinicola strongylocentroti TaxID=1795355 RepID=A0A2Z4IDL3_9BACT|nr:sulfatase [Echinicola strongylocentroti]AWW28797.1 sulfatase [Echinicola strongylocentroti]
MKPRSKPVFQLLAGIVLIVCFSCHAQEDEAGKRPNLLFIFPDQLRNAAIGVNNEDPVHTPYMDQLAKEGMVINNAISNIPLCSPYRAMLMTGKLPYHNSVLSNCNSARYRYNNSWQKEDVSFSDILRRNGYDAGYVGKLHLTSPAPIPGIDSVIWDAYTPPEDRHGFNFWYSYGTFDQHHSPHYWVNNAPKDELKEVQEWSAKHEAEVIIDYIKNDENRNKDKPFALFWSVNPPHPPYPLVPAKYLKPYENKSNEELLVRENVRFGNTTEELARHPGGTRGRTDLAKEHAKDYFAMVTGVDAQIGRVLAALEEEGLSENTIVVVTSDHGEMMGSHGLMSKNVWFDEAINIPFIIRWPAKIKANQESDAFISVPDVMPTLLNLMGATDGIPRDLDGSDLSTQILENSPQLPDYALYYYIEAGQPASGHRGIKTSKATYVITYDKSGKKHHFLYDNVNDPFQMHNIAADDPDLAKLLHEKLLKALEEKKDPWLRKHQLSL